MKNKNFLCSIIVLALLLIICAFVFSGKFAEESCEKTINEVLHAIENNDEKKFVSMFSEAAINDSESFEENISKLFVGFKGEIINVRKGGHSGAEDIDGFYKKETHQAWYQVDTTEGDYIFVIIQCFKDTRNRNNVGVSTVYVIKTENDDTSFEWEEVSCPGAFFVSEMLCQNPK